MSLQTKLLILVTTLTLMLALAMVAREAGGTRRSVHEEIRTAHRVAEQLMGHLAGRPQAEVVRELTRLGRIRAHDIQVRDAAGQAVYTSPRSPYKAGRAAPGWFAGWITPVVAERAFDLPDGGRLLLRADASRAVLDGWDDFIALAQWLALGLALLGLLCWKLVRQALAPLTRIERALREIQKGRLDTRLPPLPGREAKLMGEAFNDMARGLQDTLAAREEARQAQRRLSAAQEMAVAVQRHVEEERRHIARELHDEMGQQITAIRSLGLVIANRAATQAGHAGMTGLKEAAGLLVEATARLHDALRRIIPRLRPVALDHFGLRDALLDLIAECRLQAPGLRFDVHLPSVMPVLDDARQTALYRAAQEAITNVIRHADARRASLVLRLDAGRLHLEIEDDGRGMPVDEASPNESPAGAAPGAAPATGTAATPRGFGLLGMRERIDALQGYVTFEPARPQADAQAGRGLRVRIALPLVAEAA